MKLLLDTHTIIWVLTGDKRLPKKVIDLIVNPDNFVYFSLASIWEIAIKNYKYPKICPYKEEEIYEDCVASGFEELPIKNEHLFAIKKLKIREGKQLTNFDPFDRILLSQAKVENCLFITADGNLDNYDEKLIYKI